MAQTLLNINQYGATVGGASNAYQFYLVVTLNSQSIARNSSNITVTHTANGRNGWGYNGFYTPSSTITVGGTQRASETVGSIPTNGASVQLSTWSGNVTHNSDGTLSLSVSAVYAPGTSTSYVPATNTLSGTITLPTIPRASDVTVSNYTVSNTTGSLSATITSKANFYHRWRWKVGSGSWNGWYDKGLIATTSSTVSVSNADLLRGITTSSTATFTIEVATYSDSSYANHVGTKSASASITITVKPTVSLGNIALNSGPNEITVPIAGYSTVKSTWSATPGTSASNGTTYFTISTGTLVSSSSTRASGTVTSGTVPANASNYTLTITAYTIDSRGIRSNNVSKSITVYGYQPPVADLTAYRVAQENDTEEDGAGTWVYVNFSGTTRSTVNNQNSTQSVSVSYTGSISGTIAGSTSSATSHWVQLTDSSNATFTLTVRDMVTSSTAIVSVAPALYPLDLYDDGHGTIGVAFGTTAERGKVKSAIPLEVNGSTTINGYLQTNGSGANSRIIAQDSVHNGQVRLTFVNNHTQHGVYSMGYSADGTTWTSDGKWIICRTSDNKVRLNGNKSWVDANGNFRAEGYGSFGGNLYVDGTGLTVGSTTKANTVNSGCHSLAGKIYLESGNSATANKSVYVMNNAGTYKAIIVVDQSNEATFYGKLSGSIATVTATLASSASFTTLSYPSGFTVSNSVIINWAINTNTASNPAWATGHGLASGSDRTFVQQNKTNILFYNNQSAYYGKTVRVVLMKIG